MFLEQFDVFQSYLCFLVKFFLLYDEDGLFNRRMELDQWRQLTGVNVNHHMFSECLFFLPPSHPDEGRIKLFSSTAGLFL